MNYTKKWLSLVLALVLAIALAVPALAITFTWDMLKNGFDDDNDHHYNGNPVLAEEEAYTPETVSAAVQAFQRYWDDPRHSQAEKDDYNAFKEAIRGLEFKAHSFTDAPSSWYDKALNYVGATGKMNGVGGGRFDPQGTMTRAMAVTILWRMNGEPAAKAAAGFKDVPANAWYAKAVAWAVEQKITTGKSAAVFDPNAPVTREQMASFFSRLLFSYVDPNNPDYVRLKNLSPTNLRAILTTYFSDADQISEYALLHVAICREIKLVRGNADGSFAPLANITRAQGAQMLLNYYQLLIEMTLKKDSESE